MKIKKEQSFRKYLSKEAGLQPQSVDSIVGVLRGLQVKAKESFGVALPTTEDDAGAFMELLTEMEFGNRSLGSYKVALKHWLRFLGIDFDRFPLLDEGLPHDVSDFMKWLVAEGKTGQSARTYDRRVLKLLAAEKYGVELAEDMLVLGGDIYLEQLLDRAASTTYSRYTMRTAAKAYRRYLAERSSATPAA